MEIGASDPGIRKFISLAKQQDVLRKKLECAQLADDQNRTIKAQYDLKQTQKGINSVIGRVLVI